MTNSAETSPKAPSRFWLTLLEVSALGILGLVPLSLLAGMALGGAALVPLAGVGLLVLVVALYIAFGIGAFEIARVSGLYDLDVKPLALKKQTKSGFGGYVRSLGTQFSDGRMWAAVGSFFVAVMAGSSVVGLVQTAVRAVTGGVRQLTVPMGTPLVGSGDAWFVGFSSSSDGTGWLGPASASPSNALWSFLVAAICLACAVGLVYLVRLVNIAIIGASAKSSALAEQTRRARASAAEQTKRAEEQAAFAAAAAAQSREDSLRREGAVRAAELERGRIERDLHDGVQPRLVSVAMTLGLAQRQIDSDPAGAQELVSEAHASTKAAITELRQLARGIHASVLDDRGLDAALSALVARSAVPVALDIRLDGPDGLPVARVNRDAEAAVYFVVAESLTNATKHSGADQVDVWIRLGPDPYGSGSALLASVRDRGVGGARVVPGGGLDGVINRVTAAGGRVWIESPPGGPTSLEVSVPCVF